MFFRARSRAAFGTLLELVGIGTLGELVQIPCIEPGGAQERLCARYATRIAPEVRLPTLTEQRRLHSWSRGTPRLTQPSAA